MTMAFGKHFLNLNKSLVLSVALHGGIFLAAIVLSQPVRSPLPLGMEVLYDQVEKKVAPAKRQITPTAIDEAGVKAKEIAAPAVIPENSALSSVRPAGPEGVANGTEVGPEQRYIYEVQKLLERKKSYPMMAKKMGHTGTVVVSFTLLADGRVSESMIVERSPYTSLNQAAEILIKSIDGMKPFPSEIQRTSWKMTLPIRYELH